MSKFVQANAVSSSDYELARSLVTGRVDDWSLGTWDLVLA